MNVTAAGICGSDLHMLGQGEHPFVLGHEFGGVLEDGRLVAVQPFTPCHDCPPCREGLDHLCVARSLFHGVSRDGGMADRVLVDPAALVLLPPAVDPLAVALVEPLAVVLHGLHRLGDLEGRRLLVIGGGSIGLLAVAAGRGGGAAMGLLARYDAQREAAQRLGAEAPVGDGYDVVIDAVGSQASLNEAVQRVASGGTILELGFPWEPLKLPTDILVNEIDFLPSILYGHHHGAWEFEMAARLLADLPDLHSVLVTHRFPLERADEAFRVAADRRAGAIKVHLVPG